MAAICRLWPGSALEGCAREVRMSGKLGAGRGVCSGIAVAVRGTSIPARLRVSVNAMDDGVEGRDPAWETLPTGTDQLLEQLGNEAIGLRVDSLQEVAGGSQGRRPQQVESATGNGVQEGYVGLFVRLLGVDNSPEEREEAVQALRRHASLGLENVDEILAFPGCLNLVVSLLPSDRPETAEAAARLLRHVSEVNVYRSLVADCGGVEEIAGLLTRRTIPEEVREQVLCVLWNLSVEEKWRSKIAKLELVPVLVALLDSEHDVVKEAAAGVLSNLSLSDENHHSLAKAGCVEKFARLLQKDLKDTTKVMRQEARNLLLELARTADLRISIIEQGLVPVPLVGASAYKSFKPLLDATPAVPQNIKVEQSAEKDTVFGAGRLLLGLKIGSNAHDIDEATRAAREGVVRQQFLARIGVLEKERFGKGKSQLATDERRFTFMPLWDGLPRLILILGLEDTEVSQRAAESIAEIAVNEENRVALHKAGAVPHLVRMLGCGDESATEAAVAALDKLAISPKIRKSIAAHGAVDALVAIVKANSSSESLNEKAVAALAHLSQTGESEAQSLVEAGTVPGLMEIARSQNACVEVKEEVEEILEEILVRKGDVRSQIITAGGVPPLVNLMSSGKPSQAEKAASVLENLVVAEANALVVLSSGLEDALKKALGVYLDKDLAGAPLLPGTNEDDWRVVRAACRLLARLVVHGRVRSLLNCPGLKTILHGILMSNSPLDVRGWVGACLQRLDGQVLEVNFTGQVVGHGTISSLIKEIRVGQPERQEAAVLALQRSVCGGSDIAAIANEGGISALVKLLENGTPRAKEAAIHVLHNLAMNEENQLRILAAGAGPVLARVGRLELPGWRAAIELLRALPS